MPTSFEYFRRLPPEIQIKVWAFADPEPCVIEIGPCDRSFHEGYAVAAIPSLLHACAQSRKVAMSQYFRGHSSFRNPTFVHKLDYIYVGCSQAPRCANGYCPGRTCKRDLTACLARDLTGRALYEVLPHTNPFIYLSIMFIHRGIEEILFVDSNSSKSDGEAKISDFREITTPFEWQREKSLLQCWKDQVKDSKIGAIPGSLKRIVRVEYFKGLNI
ncbi:hypothetical protein BKA61DRAFT_275518 [Leptodontidium sp. MPI-SDFR-AT-0119]|nr:hypothetical protein BKA61DRAFT_275518 [Leptodontidium sp. MPI-SDFR-AT-0119]